MLTDIGLSNSTVNDQPVGRGGSFSTGGPDPRHPWWRLRRYGERLFDRSAELRREPRSTSRREQRRDRGRTTAAVDGCVAREQFIVSANDVNESLTDIAGSERRRQRERWGDTVGTLQDQTRTRADAVSPG